MSVPPICNKCGKIEEFGINMGNLNELINYLDNYICDDCSDIEINRKSQTT